MHATGIGAASACELAAQGATVVVSYRSNNAAAETLAQSIWAAGRQIVLYQSDAHYADQVQELVQRTYEIAGHIDMLVHSVPSRGLIKPFLTFTWDEFILGIDTEMKSAYETARAMLPLMRQQHSGHLVYVTSDWAKHPSIEGLTSLTPAFAALVGWVKVLAKECGRDGITVNAVAPGMVDTDLSSQMPPQVRQQITAMTPLGRIATPEDIAQVIAFLASDASGFMTGTYVPVSGGLTMD